MKLTKMNQEEYNLVKGKMIADYSKEKIRLGVWAKEEALDLSKETFEALLKNGAETENNYLYNVLDSGDNNIAYVWFAKQNQEVFIYNIDVFEEYKEKFEYDKILNLIEEKVESLGGKKLSVHTFGYNEELIEKYKKFGFEITDVTLSKEI